MWSQFQRTILPGSMICVLLGVEPVYRLLLSFLFPEEHYIIEKNVFSTEVDAAAGPLQLDFASAPDKIDAYPTTTSWLVIPWKHVFPSETEDEAVDLLQFDFASAPDKMDANPTTTSWIVVPEKYVFPSQTEDGAVDPFAAWFRLGTRQSGCLPNDGKLASVSRDTCVPLWDRRWGCRPFAAWFRPGSRQNGCLFNDDRTMLIAFQFRFHPLFADHDLFTHEEHELHRNGVLLFQIFF